MPFHLTGRLPQACLKSLVAIGLLSPLLAACQQTPLSLEPVNKTLSLSLPPLSGAAPQLSDSQTFSFRLITPAENVDLFSILQFRLADQNTLPVAQLEEVQLARERILNEDFLQPDQIGILTYQTAALYNWDLEIARQIIVELTQTYVDKRDADHKRFIELADQRATYYREKGLRRITESTAQDAAVIEKMFGGIPTVKPVDEEERQRRFDNYVAYTAYMAEKNRRAQEEYNRQAKAAHDKLMTQWDEQRERARAKEERANEIRQQQLEALLGVQSLNEERPYDLLALANGDFMLKARASLPAVIQLKIDGFDQAIAVPVLPQTRQGRLLLSVQKDAQGQPLVLGGLDAPSGLRFDLNAPMFSVSTRSDGSQELNFLYPDGRSETFDISDLQPLSSEQALQTVSPRETSLNPAQLSQLRSQLQDLRYQFTPELAYMDPLQAAAVLENLNRAL